MPGIERARFVLRAPADSSGRMSTRLSCTMRWPRYSLICGVNARSTRSPTLTAARRAVVEKKMADPAVPPARQAEAQVFPPADLVSSSTRKPRSASTGRGIQPTPHGSARRAPRRFQRQEARRDLAVGLQRGLALAGGAERAGKLCDLRAERINIFAPDGKAGGQLVPAVALQQRRERPQRGKQVEAPGATGRMPSPCRRRGR